jgi:hypothetical protein
MIDQQLENLGSLNCVGGVTTNDARCTRDIKSKIAMAKGEFNKKTVFTSKLDLNLRKKLVTCYIWNIEFYGTETSKRLKIDQQYLESF